MACAIFLPYGILAKAALSRAWAQPLTAGQLHAGNFTFTFFEYGATRDAIVNTLELGVATATIGAVLVALLSYVTNRRLIRGPPARGRSWRSRPIVIRAWSWRSRCSSPTRGPPLVLYGTLAILFIAVPDQGDAGRLRAVGRHFRAIPPSSRTPAASSAPAACGSCATSPRRWPAAASSPPGASSSSG
jgi:hypothetical protein